jgi:PAS domain S-box-containing protein
MGYEPYEIGIARQLSRQLLPLALGVALLISGLLPACYYLLEARHFEDQTVQVAEWVAREVAEFSQPDLSLWKNQPRKFTELIDDLRPGSDLLGFSILDERDLPVRGYDYVNEKLKGRWEPQTLHVRYPINVGKHRLGTVDVAASRLRIVEITAIIFAISAVAGVSLALLTYRFPVRVVRRMEWALDGLVDTVQMSEQKYRSLVENIPDVTWTADRDGTPVFISPNLERVYGYTHWEVLNAGTSLWFGSIHPDDVGRVKKAYEALFSTGGVFDEEYRVWGKKLECIWLHSRATGTYERDGNLYADGIIANITERKQAETAMAEQARELARSNAELEQFAYVASHDLQEPLRMVSSYVQLLARRYRGRLDADADDFIAYAVDGAQRMQRLINDLLAYSRVGTRGKPFVLTDCAGVVRYALDNLQESVRESGARIVVGDLPTLLGDETQLVQLFQNLLGNALKFRGEVPLLIEVGAVPRPDGWEFYVTDNGIGIESHHHERIFQIFQRLHERDKYPGTGIGLAICKKIVERHGGEIRVESGVGRGASFRFFLPADTLPGSGQE